MLRFSFRNGFLFISFILIINLLYIFRSDYFIRRDLIKLKSKGVTVKKPSGAIYETSIQWPDAAREASDPLSEHHLLDWDKPIGKQSKQIQTAIQSTKQFLPSSAMDDLGGDLSLIYSKDVTPAEFLNTWESLTGNAGSGEKALFQQGIPGIKYLDQGSRTGGGTSNYVMFGDEYPQIVNRAGSLAQLLRNK